MIAVEEEYPLAGLTLRGKRWHKGAPHKVLALHGWLDNCASFDRLLPLLPDFEVLALDLAGQGLSDFRPGLGAYNIWQDCSELYQLQRVLGWPKCVLLGHSRGAMIASLYAGSFPENVSALCLIDAVLPLTCSAEEAPQQLATAIRGLVDGRGQSQRYYATRDLALNAREKALFPLAREACAVLADRSLLQNEQGYYWRYDSRLLMASEFRMSREQALAFVDRYPCPALLLASFGADDREHPLFAAHDKLRHVKVAGSHHLHLDNNDLTLAKLAETISNYVCEQHAA